MVNYSDSSFPNGRVKHSNALPESEALRHMNPQLLILLAEFIEDEVRLDSSLKDDLGMDSMDIVKLVMDINQTFGITIHSSEVIPAYFDTVESVQDFIARKQKLGY